MKSIMIDILITLLVLYMVKDRLLSKNRNRYYIWMPLAFVSITSILMNILFYIDVQNRFIILGSALSTACMALWLLIGILSICFKKVQTYFQ